MQSRATTVRQYLAELSPDRRQSIEAVRQTILSNLDRGYEEGMQYGMIGYYVPHGIYPAGYHCDPKQPLPFICLASQKNYMSLYLASVYGNPALAKWFQEAWKKTGKKLDMGKSCIRFKRVEDLALDVIGEAIKKMPVATWIEVYESSLKSSSARARKQAGKKTERRSSTAQKAPRKKSQARTGKGPKTAAR